MTETAKQILETVKFWQEEDRKFFECGNKAAGTRARKALMELTKLAKARRGEISDEKAAMAAEG